MQYGGEDFGVYSAAGLGTITTEYAWVRDQIPDPNHPGQFIDDPLDHPPEEVIVQEYCRVYAFAQNPGGPFGADADNGLGFDTNTEYGQDWTNVGIEVPSPLGQVGEGCFMQLITAARDLYRTAPHGYFLHYQYRRTAALDGSFPYAVGSGTWDLPARGRSHDSPFQEFAFVPSEGGGANWYKAEAHDSFETWLMFKPPPAVQNQLCVWIPISRYAWKWDAHAEKQEGNWV